jgi:uncharacterized membrane protein
MQGLTFVLVLLATLGSGLMAGLFFVFSVAIMTALSRLMPHEGVAAMQHVNVVIINPLFALVFFGTAALCLAVLIMGVWRFAQPGAVYLIAGAALYLAASILVTILFNVPLNDRLAAVAAGTPEAAALWRDYLVRWTQWNHVRTLGCTASAALLINAMWYQGRGA